MHLTKELFVIPNGENFILYAPLKRAVAEVNEDVMILLKRIKTGENIGDMKKKLDQLKQVGIVTEGETPIIKYIPEKDFNPTSVTIIPSLNCNLRCIYCYSRAGEGVGKIMNIEVAKSAIDFIIRNAKAKGDKKVGLDFHGGGEPFIGINMGLIKEAVKYFRNQAASYNLTPRVTSITNGVMNKETLEWVASNFDELNISFDGPEDIQNKQRPTIEEGNSFSDVLKTVKYLESRKFKYQLRATITKDSVSRMPEIVEFFSSISSTDHFLLEPLFECGRCKTSKVEAPSPEDYLKYLIKSRKVAEKLGRMANYSGSIIEGVYDCFCGSLDKGFFCVLPEGDVTSCLEVCRTSDPRANIFIIGKYDFDAKKFIFYKDRIQTLRSRNVDNIPNCADCFAKYNCAGDCPAKVYTQSGSLFDTSNNIRCDMKRGSIKHVLLEKLKGGNKK